MKLLLVLLTGVLVALAGCGGGSDSDDAEAGQADAVAETEASDGNASGGERQMKQDREQKRRGGGSGKADGTEIEVGDSEFGRMLFDSDDQAIYIFENDREDETVCYGQCAQDWPPVLTDGDPQAGKGVKDSLLGTVKRRGGERQVTYDGQPLYYYVDEAPGEVRCHNVDLNGGLWWVVGPDGNRLQ